MRITIRFLVAGLAALLMFAQVSFATIINVPGDQPTIQAGINAAYDGDTVLVSPGVYTENLDFSNKTIRLIGQAGADQTVLQPANPLASTIIFQGGEGSQTELSGFTVRNGGGVEVTVQVSGDASPLITHNIFRDNFPDHELIHCSAPAQFRRNLFYNNGGISCIGIGGAGVQIINNTFDRNARGFYSMGATTAKNNIVTNSSEYGIYGVFSELDYNDVWNNNPNFSNSTPGIHDISVDPLYNGADDHDYSLAANSPCIDAGDPSPEFDDPDGTRNDMGAFPRDQIDGDGDGIGDWRDNCPEVYNPGQKDGDGDGIGDSCDVCTDNDRDGFGNPGFPKNTCPTDNCPLVANPGQEDFDGDSVGNACDPCDCTHHCDLNRDQVINPLDVVIIVGFVYKDIDIRQPLTTICSANNGDWNCNGWINPTDVVMYVNYVYKSSGVGPCDPCVP